METTPCSRRSPPAGSLSSQTPLHGERIRNLRRASFPRMWRCVKECRACAPWLSMHGLRQSLQPGAPPPAALTGSCRRSEHNTADPRTCLSAPFSRLGTNRPMPGGPPAVGRGWCVGREGGLVPSRRLLQLGPGRDRDGRCHGGPVLAGGGPRGLLKGGKGCSLGVGAAEASPLGRGAGPGAPAPAWILGRAKRGAREAAARRPRAGIVPASGPTREGLPRPGTCGGRSCPEASAGPAQGSRGGAARGGRDVQASRRPCPARLPERKG